MYLPKRQTYCIYNVFNDKGNTEYFKHIEFDSILLILV